MNVNVGIKDVGFQMNPKVGQIWLYDKRVYYFIANQRDDGSFKIIDIKTGNISYSYLENAQLEFIQ